MTDGDGRGCIRHLTPRLGVMWHACHRSALARSRSVDRAPRWRARWRRCATVAGQPARPGDHFGYCGRRGRGHRWRDQPNGRVSRLLPTHTACPPASQPQRHTGAVSHGARHTRGVSLFSLSYLSLTTSMLERPRGLRPLVNPRRQGRDTRKIIGHGGVGMSDTCSKLRREASHGSRKVERGGGSPRVMVT